MAEELTIKRYEIDKVGAMMTTPAESVKKLSLNDEMSAEVNRGFAFGQDFQLYNNERDVCLVSECRNISIKFSDMVLLRDKDEQQATQNFNYVIDLLSNADKRFEATGFPSEVCSKLYFNIVRESYENLMDVEEHHEMIQTKRESKQAAKDSVKNKWFKIGKYYSLKKFDLNGNIKDINVFKCVKFIYTVGINQVNHVVMQKIGEPLNGNARTLSRLDCKMWHIKYSPDLYMFSMNQRFYPVGEKELEVLQKKQVKAIKAIEVSETSKSDVPGERLEKKQFSPENVRKDIEHQFFEKAAKTILI